MSDHRPSSASNSFMPGGDLQIHRLAYGAMRITGNGVWGPPSDVAGVLATLNRLPGLGVNFIDTADSNGPEAGGQKTLLFENPNVP